jgi:hypothetical protein
MAAIAHSRISQQRADRPFLNGGGARLDDTENGLPVSQALRRQPHCRASGRSAASSAPKKRRSTHRSLLMLLVLRLELHCLRLPVRGRRRPRQYRVMLALLPER